MADVLAVDIPDLSGTVALVTGTSRGIGREVARQLAAHGAMVLAGVRGQPAASEALPGAELVSIDLSDMGSVGEGVAGLRGRVDHLDLLIHCAGIMATPYRTTVDGFELQLATNYLGPVLLTHELLPMIEASDAGRVVMVSSPEAMLGKLNLDDLNLEEAYSWPTAYRQSKLACVMFAIELNTRAAMAGKKFTAMAAHPGFTRTDIITRGLKEAGDGWRRPFMSVMARVMAQPVEQGALPILYAATSREAQGGGYYGPDRMGGLRGLPTAAKMPPIAEDASLRRALWERTEAMLGIRLPLPEDAGAPNG